MRLEFSDAQKAEIFARDRAVCSFSGKSLWLFDYGISPTYDIDWVDHIRPAAHGGDNSVENGVCASYFYNAKKRANVCDNKYLFFHGRPTAHFFYFHECVPAGIASHLARFARADASDWYFNRAAFRFMLGLSSIRHRRRGKPRKRDEHYYARAAVKMLRKWRRMGGSLDSINARGLLSPTPSPDQRALQALAEIEDETRLLEQMNLCFSWYDASCDAINELSRAATAQEMTAVCLQYAADDRLPRRVKEMMTTNATRL